MNKTIAILILIMILFPLIALAATEDFTTYTEVDPGDAYLTVTAASTSYASMPASVDAYVYDDKTAAHFDGDFEHLVTMHTGSATTYGDVFWWSLANQVDDYRAIWVEDDDALGIEAYRDNGGCYFYLNENDGGTFYIDNGSVSFGTTYYAKIKRDESVGTYGTLYAYIYDDAARTSLHDTLSVTLHSSKKDFRYIYCAQTYNGGVSARQYTGWTADLDLQEAVRRIILPRP